MSRRQKIKKSTKSKSKGPSAVGRSGINWLDLRRRFPLPDNLKWVKFNGVYILKVINKKKVDFSACVPVRQESMFELKLNTGSLVQDNRLGAVNITAKIQKLKSAKSKLEKYYHKLIAKRAKKFTKMYS